MVITNPQMRRILRHYVEHYNGIDSRHVIELFHEKFNCTKQRVSGNLSWAIIGQETLKANTNIVGVQSDLLMV